MKTIIITIFSTLLSCLMPTQSIQPEKTVNIPKIQAIKEKSLTPLKAAESVAIKETTVIPQPVQKVTRQILVAPGSEAEAKAFIYQHESGNNPASVNDGGCRGLGQACPGSKLPCSNSDYACQDTWFTDYMLGRYGTWQKAKAFWLARVPINGKDVGNWW